MRIAPCNTVAPKHATTTLTALIKSATLTSINAALIPTALIGQSAARIPLVVMGREIVMKTQDVKVYLSVALTIVPMKHLLWTAVNMRYIKVKNI